MLVAKIDKGVIKKTIIFTVVLLLLSLLLAIQLLRVIS